MPRPCPGQDLALPSSELANFIATAKSFPSFVDTPEPFMKQILAPARQAKPRALSHSNHFFQAVVLYTVHLFCLIATITLIVLLMKTGHENAPTILAASIGISAFTGVIAYIKRRGTICPLCRSASLIGTRACRNERAKRIWPFSFAVSSMISIIFLQRFRCMHCGTDFDLLKEPRRQQLHKEEKRKKRVRSKRRRRINRIRQ